MWYQYFVKWRNRLKPENKKFPIPRIRLKRGCTNPPQAAPAWHGAQIEAKGEASRFVSNGRLNTNSSPKFGEKFLPVLARLGRIGLIGRTAKMRAS
jgi:hypothetical protein